MKQIYNIADFGAISGSNDVQTTKIQAIDRTYRYPVKIVISELDLVSCEYI